MLGRSVPRVSRRAPRGQFDLAGADRPLTPAALSLFRGQRTGQSTRDCPYGGWFACRAVARARVRRPVGRTRCLRRGGTGCTGRGRFASRRPGAGTPKRQVAVAGGPRWGVELPRGPVIASPVDDGVAPCPGYSRMRPSRTASRYRSTLLDVSLPTSEYLARARFRWVLAVPGLIPTTRATLSSFMPDA